jgi:uncharacterized protein
MRVLIDTNVLISAALFPRSKPAQALESFISNSLFSIEIVDTPEIPVEEEKSMRDMMDRPILRSAIVSSVDIILTGDKDFLESEIDHPQMMTPSDFLYVRPSEK